MLFKISDIEVVFYYNELKKLFSLSNSRNILELRSRKVILDVSFEEKGSYQSSAEIFDSDKWARPDHIFGESLTEVNLKYFSVGSEYVVDMLKGNSFLSPVEYEFYLLLLSDQFDMLFSRKYNYKSSPIMKMMLIAPFSNAFSDCFHQYTGKSLLCELIKGSYRSNLIKAVNNSLINDWYNLEYSITKFQEISTATLLYTIDISMSIENIKSEIIKQNLSQIKVKVSSNDKSTKKTVELMNMIKKDFPNLRLYIDANQSFLSIKDFKEFFIDPIANVHQDFLNYIIGFEEITIEPFKQSKKEIQTLGVCIFLDENSGEFSDLHKIKEMGYGIALKSTRPLAVLAFQIIYCQSYSIELCVQDLTFCLTTLTHNLWLYRYCSTSIGIESNFGFLVPESVNTKNSLRHWNSLINLGVVHIPHC